MALPRIFTQHRRILLLLMVALVPRLAFVLSSSRPVWSDEQEYHLLASSLQEHASYNRDGSPTAYRPVGYPLFLSAIYTILGPSPLAAKVIQSVLDSCTCLLLLAIGMTFSPRTGWIAAFLWALFPAAILYVNLILSESVFVFLVVLLLYCLVCPPRWLGKNIFLASGASIGALALVKPFALVLLPFLFLFSRRMAVPRRAFLILLLGCTAVLLPWLVRNALVLDRFALSTNGGLNLFIGNNPQTTGAYLAVFPEELITVADDEIELERRATSMAAQYIRTHPVTFVVNGMKKIAHVFRMEGELLIWSFSPIREVHEIRFAEKYAALPLRTILAVNIPTCAIFLLGALGGFLAKPDRLFWFTAAFVLSMLSVYFVFFGGSRFHFPFMPMLVLFASQAVASFLEHRISLSVPRRIAFLGLSLALCSLWTYEFSFIFSFT